MAVTGGVEVDMGTAPIPATTDDDVEARDPMEDKELLLAKESSREDISSSFSRDLEDTVEAKPTGGKSGVGLLATLVGIMPMPGI